MAASIGVEGAPSLSSGQKLALYALYKQATSGDCPSPLLPPSAAGCDGAALAKWDAWASLRGVGEGAAQRAYVSAAEGALSVEAVDAAEAAGGVSGAAGVVSSRPVPPQEGDETGGVGGVTIAHKIAAEGDVEALRLLDAHWLDRRDDGGCLPLHWAADRGQTAAAEALLTLGADPDARDEDGSTPLHYAGMCGHKETFEALIRLGADPEAKDNDGEVPVLEADA
uniref:ACB domain-containing protein n=1 Tax=Prasinoderma singulare TaxID=676789 RepID=A0A7S3BW90_9VIRI